MGLISLSERSNEKLCKHKFSTSLGQVFAASSCFEFADLKIIKKDLEEKKQKFCLLAVQTKQLRPSYSRTKTISQTHFPQCFGLSELFIAEYVYLSSHRLSLYQIKPICLLFMVLELRTGTAVGLF